MSAPKRRLSNGSGCLLKICEDDNSDDEGSIISNQEKSLYTFPKRQNNRRRSSIGGLNSKVPINPVEQARIAEMYKTVIQMSSENKLTEKNSWNYDLIDHMGKLIKDDNRGVNFQKASCTLDASVKIYSNRVDDTYSSSHRILESLSRNGTINHNTNEDDDETNNEDGDDVNGKRQTKLGSKTSRLQLAQTIEKNVNALNAVKLENDIAVDPMFHKISKAFDEGGAKGMLMNNLRLTPSTSSLSFYFPDNPNYSTSIVTHNDANITNTMNTTSIIDLSDLLRRADIPLVELSTITICPALDMYRDQICITCDTSVLDMIANICPSSSGAISSSTNNITNDIIDVQQVHIEMFDNANDQFDDNDDSYTYEHDDDHPFTSSSPSNSSEQVHEATKLRWADVSNEQDKQYLAADLEILTEGMDKISLSGPSEYSYFDTNAIFACNNAWAGAKHWKYATRSNKKILSQPSFTAEGSNNSENRDPITLSKESEQTIVHNDTGKLKKTTKSRVENINYDTIILCDDSMFDYTSTTTKNDPTLQASSTLTKLESKDATSMLLLPPDAKVQVKDLCRLFLAPNVIIPANSQQLATLLTTTNARQQRSGSSKIDKFLGCQSGSERVWGVKAPEAISILGTLSSSGMANGNNAHSFEDTSTTQHDDYYDDDNGDGYDDHDINNNESLFGLNINQNQLVQADRKVEKIEIGYAKVSKRVNIQRLKTDIWSNLRQNLHNKELENEEMEENMNPNKQILSMKNNMLNTQAPSSLLSFQNLIYEISSETNEMKQKDVTLPFYFICLLHLANEHNLKIEDCVEMNELTISMDTK